MYLQVYPSVQLLHSVRDCREARPLHTVTCNNILVAFMVLLLKSKKLKISLYQRVLSELRISEANYQSTKSVLYLAGQRKDDRVYKQF